MRLGSAIGAAALHLLLLSAVGLGTTVGKPSPPRAGDPDIRLASTDEDAVSAMIFIDPSVLSQSQGISVAQLAIPAPTLKVLSAPRLVRVSVPELVGDGGSPSKSATSTTAVDGPERAKLFGRYVNQIVARVERGWMRPHTPPSGTTFWGRPVLTEKASRSPAGKAELPPLFKCRAQILQSRAGEVLEVTLLDCDSSAEWERSLVNAIDAASPLPAPADASVFARSLTLSFTSAAPSSGPAPPSAALRMQSARAEP